MKKLKGELSSLKKEKETKRKEISRKKQLTGIVNDKYLKQDYKDREENIV